MLMMLMMMRRMMMMMIAPALLDLTTTDHTFLPDNYGSDWRAPIVGVSYYNCSNCWTLLSSIKCWSNFLHKHGLSMCVYVTTCGSLQGSKLTFFSFCAHWSLTGQNLLLFLLNCNIISFFACLFFPSSVNPSSGGQYHHHHNCNLVTKKPKKNFCKCFALIVWECVLVYPYQCYFSAFAPVQNGDKKVASTHTDRFSDFAVLTIQCRFSSPVYPLQLSQMSSRTQCVCAYLRKHKTCDQLSDQVRSCVHTHQSVCSWWLDQRPCSTFSPLPA